jgi:hypothetical protein
MTRRFFIPKKPKQNPKSKTSWTMFFLLLTGEDALHNSRLHDAKIIRRRRACLNRTREMEGLGYST